MKLWNVENGFKMAFNQPMEKQNKQKDVSFYQKHKITISG